MASVWKDILAPGYVVLPDSHGEYRRRDFSADDLRNAADQGNQMLRSGRAVPGIWEHDDDIESLSAQERARLNAQNVYGWVGAYRVSSGGRLQARLDDIDRGDVSRLRKTRYCSPRLHWDFRDEDGTLWPGMTVQHVAATPLPVQRSQNAWNLSHKAQPAIKSTKPNVINLSRASILEMSMAEDEFIDADEAVETDVEPPIPEGGGGDVTVADLIAALETCGVMLGPGAEAITDMSDLHHRIIAAAHTKSGSAPMDDPDDYDDDYDDEVVEENPQVPVMLSRAAQHYGRQALCSQIRRLCKRKNVPKKKVDQLVAKVMGDPDKKKAPLQLSFDAQGRMKTNAVTEALEFLDLVAPTDSRKRTEQLSRGDIAVQEPPDNLDQQSGARRDEKLKKKARADAERLSVTSTRSTRS